MMRLDKYLGAAAGLSRSESGACIRKGRVCVNGAVLKNPDAKVNEQTDAVTLDGETLCYRAHTYLMLNKPEGYVSSTDDPSGPTVLELLPEKLRKGLFPCGRLDKNTTGLLLLTDDGALSHALLRPKSHAEKVYAFTCARPVRQEDAEALERGVEIDGYLTAPCRITTDAGSCSGTVTLIEGKYHQIKRMFRARCNKILTLRRIRFGGVALDPSLPEGGYRFLTETELAVLQSAAQTLQKK